uniref:Calcitonin n=1 Tax=Loxodonta africana TaxID=9785 RepID=G5E702_LOXAF
MGFWKLSPFLAVGILVLWQVGSLQAAPFRSALESSSDSTVLNEEEARLLLATLVKDFVQLKTRELAHETEDSRSFPCSLDSFRTKRCSSLSTCMLGAYSQDLNKFHTFSGYNFGSGAHGKTR